MTLAMSPSDWSLKRAMAASILRWRAPTAVVLGLLLVGRVAESILALKHKLRVRRRQEVVLMPRARSATTPASRSAPGPEATTGN
jgi:hypothetical protein